MDENRIDTGCGYESWLDIIRLVIYGRRQMHAVCRYGVVNIVNVTRETRLKGNNETILLSTLADTTRCGKRKERLVMD